MNFLPTDVAAACVSLGPTVGPLPPSIDGGTLLWALAGNESSHGVNCGPRHEPAFDVGGTFYADSPEQQALIAKFPYQAACSFGPLQIMFCNAPEGATPADFDDLTTAMQYSVAFLNKQLARWKPLTLTTLGQIWNSGEPRRTPSPGVVAYCNALTKGYMGGLP